MHLQYTSYVFLIALTAALSVALTIVAWQRHDVRAAGPFGFLTLAIFEWSLGYAFELSSADLPMQIFWARVEYFGVVAVPLAWFAFTLVYTGREQWLGRRGLIFLGIVPLVTILLVWISDWHGLIWNHMAALTAQSFSMMSPSYGAWLWVHTASSYVLILGGSTFILQNITRTRYLAKPISA